jgi:hypothetical protein
MLKTFKRLLRQSASPVFIGWYLRMAEADVRVDASPVVFPMMFPDHTPHTKEEVRA